MLYSDSLREMMQNAVNESFWDAHGVEIGPCAFFEHFARSDKMCPEGNFFVDWMLWVPHPHAIKPHTREDITP